MKEETEVKLPVRSLDRVRDELRRAGAHPVGAADESNIVWDRDGELAARGELLRLRADQHATLTWKGPAGSENGIKSREEIETRVADFEACRTILNRLGYQAVVTYAKYRETWELGGTEIALDRLHFGDFVEIEGLVDAIVHVAAVLRLDLRAAVEQNYVELQADAERGTLRLEAFADA